MSFFLFILLLAGIVWAVAEAREAHHKAKDLALRMGEEQARHARRVEELNVRLRSLELWRNKEELPPISPPPAIPPVSRTPKVTKEPAARYAPPPAPTQDPAMIADPPPQQKASSVPPPLPASARTVVVPQAPRAESPPPAMHEVAPPPSPPTTSLRSGLNWEQFLGVKFFAWVGGLLTFLTVAFFIKLSFERGWISNEMRIITGFVLGLSALVGGIRLHQRERYRVLAQTFCATGTLILYGSTYSAHAIYGFIGAGTAFAIMAFITTTAFVLAVRLEAQVIAVLGMVGGLLTPVLCSTGKDQPLALFSYIALLNVGLGAVVRRRPWFYLISLAAFGTIFMELGWSAQFFVREGYAHGVKTWLFVAVFAFFAAQFAVMHHRLDDAPSGFNHTLASALAVGSAAVLAAMVMLLQPSILERPLIGFSLMSFLFALSVWMRWHRSMEPIVPGALGLAWIHVVLWIGGTGSDHVFILLAQVFLLTLAALTIDKLKPGSLLPLVAGVGAMVAQFIWGARFFESGGYTTGFATMGVMLALIALPLLHLMMDEERNASSTLLLCGSAMLASFAMLAFRDVALRPVMLYAFVFALNTLVLRVVWINSGLQLAHGLVAGASFVHLGAWTVAWMKSEHLPVALALYLVFGAAHTAYAMLWMRRHPEAKSSMLTILPLMSIALMLLPVLNSREVSLMIWPALMIANLVVMLVAWINGRLSVVLAGMALTFVGAFLWLQKLPALDASLTRFVGVLGGISLVFMTAASLLLRRVVKLGLGEPGFPAIAVPVSAAVMPFALLTLAVTEMPMMSPTPVFGLALVLSLFLLGLGVWLKEGLLALVAMLCALAVQAVWHVHHFDLSHVSAAAVWYVGFSLLFLAYPFVFHAGFTSDRWPWIASAAAPLGTFLLVRDLVTSQGGWTHMGLLPLAFALPALLALSMAVRLLPADAGARLPALAWLGGAALFFITLIFPMEFSRQHLSMSWALEGAALIWLYHRVPHRGLIWVGLALLATVFVRLGLNLHLIESYPRGGRLIWNWHFATYGTAIASLLAAAKWLQSPHDRLFDVDVRRVLFAFAGMLGFVWINLEITDVFTPADQPTLLIDLKNASVGRRMTYSIAWASYALVLIVVGFVWRSRGARYAGIGLMVITIVKVFLRDLSGLDNLYRIGALGAVAIMALAASFVYQRFFERSREGSKSQ